MKWNIEWVDLQNIEHMVAECWRMSESQLEKYVQKLTKKQELIFAGELGVKFLEMLRNSLDHGQMVDWSKLQKDIHLMQELIQDGQAQHDVYWKSQYQELSADTKAYFGTEFGKAFTEQLAAKLDLDISDEQRMLQNDIGKIQNICLACDWDDEEKARKTLMLLTRDEKYYFSSWLGDAFINVLQERYGKKEAEKESGLRIQLDTAAVKKSSLKAKIVWTLLVCIMVGMIGFLLYMQSDDGRGREKLRELFSDVRSVMDIDRKANGRRQTGSMAVNAGYDVVQDAEYETNQEVFESNQVEIEMNQDEVETNQDEVETNQEEIETNDEESGTDHKENADNAGLIATGAGNRTDANNTVQDAELQGKTGHESVQADGGQGIGDDNAGQAAGLHAGTHVLDTNTADTGIDSNRKAAVIPDILPQYQSFHEDYPDLFGWLKIPGTVIDHPVMQSGNERSEKYYYLHRDYTGRASEAGSLFVENASSCFPQDDNTVIYGHNMSNGHNFGMLEKYKDSDFFQEHPVIQYDTIYETGTYQIVAVLITRILYQDEAGFRYYRFYNYDSQQEFQECKDFIEENQLYHTGENIQFGDKLLMLSTCEYSKPDGRLVVVAKKVG